MPTVNEVRAAWMAGFNACQDDQPVLRPVGHVALVEAYQAGWDCWTDYLIDHLHYTLMPQMNDKPGEPCPDAEFNRYVGGGDMDSLLAYTIVAALVNLVDPLNKRQELRFYSAKHAFADWWFGYSCWLGVGVPFYLRWPHL